MVVPCDHVHLSCCVLGSDACLLGSYCMDVPLCHTGGCQTEVLTNQGPGGDGVNRLENPGTP